MKMFIIGFAVAWFAFACVALISEETRHGGISLWDGWASTILTLPLLPFAFVWRVVYEIHKKLKKHKTSGS